MRSLKVLSHGCGGGGVEGGEVLQSGGPHLPLGGVGDQDGVVAVHDGHLPHCHARVQHQRRGRDGRGRSTLGVVQQDAVALLADVEFPGGGVDAAIEGAGLVVEMPDEPLSGVGDPDAAVVEIHLRRGNPLMHQSETGQ